MPEETFGAYVRRLRLALPDKPSQETLGRAAGVTRAYISQIENDSSPPANQPPNVSDDVLRKLAKALRVSEREMFDRFRRAPAGYRLVSREAFESLPAGVDEEQALRDAGVIYAAGFSELDSEGKRIVLELIRSMNRRRDFDEAGEPVSPASKNRDF